MIISEYEAFCRENGNFMQSEAWQKVKNNWKGRTVLEKDDSGKIIGEMLVLSREIPFLGISFLYVPRGPVCDFHDFNTLKKLYDKLLVIAKEEKAFALKIDPMIDQNDSLAIENLNALGLRYHPERVGYDTVQSRENDRLDLRGKTEADVFSSFASKWRYNIRISHKKGVECCFCGKEKLQDFYDMMKETGERADFYIRSFEYYERLLTAFSEKSGLCICYYKGEAIAGALWICYGGVMTYLYGCSRRDHNECKAAYLMQWEMIRLAISRGCEIYDFGGVPYWYDENHPNYGVYHFKRGFSGEVKTWAGEFDQILRPEIVFFLRPILKKKKCI